MEKGIEKGKKIGKIDDAQRMILRGIDLKLIQEVTSLSMERLTEIREKIDLARKQFLQDIEIREIQKTTGLSMEILEEIKRLK